MFITHCIIISFKNESIGIPEQPAISVYKHNKQPTRREVQNPQRHSNNYADARLPSQAKNNDL